MRRGERSIYLAAILCLTVSCGVALALRAPSPETVSAAAAGAHKPPPLAVGVGRFQAPEEPPVTHIGGFELPDATLPAARLDPTNPGDLSRVTSFSYFRPPYVSQDNVVFNMLLTQTGRLSPHQIERFNELHILPWNPLKTDCRIGELCDQRERRVAHPYEDLSIEELRSMPDHDAAVQLVLARKDPDLDRHTRMEATLRASALASKPGPLLWQSRMLGSPPGTQPLEDFDDAYLRYMLETVGALLGDERSEPEARRADLAVTLRHNGVNVAEALAEADVKVTHQLTDLSNFRRVHFGVPLEYDRQRFEELRESIEPSQRENKPNEK